MSNKKDSDAKKIGEALKRNSTLRSIDICVTGLTVHGAKSLAAGIAHSQLATISFKGEAIDHSEVMETIYREGIKQSKTIQSVSLVGPMGDMDSFVEALSSLSRLKLWFSRVTDVTWASRLGRELEKNKSIKDLSLYFEMQSLSAVELVLSSLAKREESLHSLVLRGANNTIVIEPENGVSPIACVSLMINAGKAPKEIELIDCSASESDWAQFAQSLVRPVCSLESLSISKSTLSFACIQALTEALKHNTSIKQLRLCRNKLGNEGTRELSKAFICNKSITELQLVKNKIGDDGLCEFSNVWSTDSPIESLDLSSNDFGPWGAEMILKATTSHSGLQKLILSDNAKIGVDGLHMIGDVLPTLKLKVLDCSQSPLWESPLLLTNINKTTKSTGRYSKIQAGQALVKGMSLNFYLHEFSLSSVDVPLKFKKAIRFFTDLNIEGRHLLTKQHELPPMIWCYLLAKCTKQESFVYYFLQQKPEIVASYR